MNYSTAVFLINDHVRAVQCTYDAGDNAARTTFKTLDPEIKVDDFVVVPTDTRHGMTVCKVVEVDVDVDFDSNTPMAWIVGRVERTDHEKTIQQENIAIEAVKSAEKARRKAELRDAMFKDREEQMKALEITNLNQSPDEQKGDTGE